MAEAGKDKAATLKKMRNNECNFFVLYVQFLLLFYKKS